jgi:hypothetical protein
MAWSQASPGQPKRVFALRNVCAARKAAKRGRATRRKCQVLRACKRHERSLPSGEEPEPPQGLAPPPAEVSSSTEDQVESAGHAQSFMRHTGVDNLDARLMEEDPAFAELEAAARAWIGSSVARWVWWEHQKARRYQLLQQVKHQEQLVADELAELEASMRDLQSLTGLPFVTEQGQISSLGWALVALILILPLGLLFMLIRSVQEALTNA